MAANVALGIYENVVVKNAKAMRTKTPVAAPPIVVLTPLEWLIEVRVKEPVMGIDEKKLLKILQQPKAIISCEASTIFPLAAKQQILGNYILSVFWRHI